MPLRGCSYSERLRHSRHNATARPIRFAMNTTTILKYVSVVGAIASFVCTLKVIPDVPQATSVAILAAAAALYKICDIIENAAAAPTPTPSPTTPPAAPRP